MFPVLNVCDLFAKEKEKNDNIVLHKLSDLLQEDIYIPKKPHRHTFYQILYVKEGRGIHNIDFQNKTITAPILFFLYPGQVHNLVYEDSKIDGYLINFDDYFYNSFLAKINYIDDFPFFKKNIDYCCFNVNLAKSEIETIFFKIERVYSENKKNSYDLLRVYLLELFLIINDFYCKNADNTPYSQQKNIISNFEKLLEEHFKEIHSPKYYAEKLAITPNYLNIICKNHLGKTAGDIIRDRIILESKRLLINSQLSISEISFKLNFEDNSYFTKVFKQITGITPFQFRNKFDL